MGASTRIRLPAYPRTATAHQISHANRVDHQALCARLRELVAVGTVRAVQRQEHACTWFEFGGTTL